MPGGLQPKKAAQVADRILKKPPTQQGEDYNRSTHPRSTNINLAEVKADDYDVGGSAGTPF